MEASTLKRHPPQHAGIRSAAQHQSVARACAIAEALDQELGHAGQIEIYLASGLPLRAHGPTRTPACWSDPELRSALSRRCRTAGMLLELSPPEAPGFAVLAPIRSRGVSVGSIGAFFTDRPPPSAAELVRLAAAGLSNWQARQAQRRRAEKPWVIQSGQARERERERLAYAVHGSVSQELTTAILNASSVTKLIERGEYGAAQELMGAVEATLGSASERSRELIDQLHSDSLPNDTELGTLCERICAEFSQKLALRKAVLELELGRPPQGVTSAHKEVIAFVLREALHNCVEHAQARRVGVRISAEQEALLLEIADDGVGFAAIPTDDQHKHLGLRGLRERVAVVGGESQLISSPGHGTRVVARLPLSSVWQ